MFFSHIAMSHVTNCYVALTIMWHYSLCGTIYYVALIIMWHYLLCDTNDDVALIVMCH